MKIFKCRHCSQPLYFENTLCEKCQYPLGFASESLQLFPLTADGEGIFRLYGISSNAQYRYCSNFGYGVCNWLVPVTSGSTFCRACQLNRTIPDLSKPEYLERWKKIESAKHRLIYSLLRLKLPVESKIDNSAAGLAFDFVANVETAYKTKVIPTGHARGLITINIAEADDIERELTRKKMHEVYRTVLGHFRHEVGHYYWDRLVANTENLEPYRKLFGDELQNYPLALERNYQQGPPADWNTQYISSYASAHPWEDWAETWAHYLHIIDTLETAHAYGLKIDPQVTEPSDDMPLEINADPYSLRNFTSIMNQWLPLTIAMNSLNRSMGLPDPYPFVITSAVTDKLRFIHDICYRYRQKLQPVAAG